MCCFLTVLLFVGPRAADIIFWLLAPERWNLAFGSVIWPILGIIFFPWTTLVYVVAWTSDGLSLFGWLLIAAAVIIDFAFYTGGGYFNRDRVPAYNR
jgi:hypothetical protein